MGSASEGALAKFAVRRPKYEGLTSEKNPLLVEDALMQQIQVKAQFVQKKVAEIIPALLKFGSSL